MDILILRFVKGIVIFNIDIASLRGKIYYILA